MTRQLPEEWQNADVPTATAKTGKRITQIREYEVITPLFGGGVDTQQADPVTVVRASEVRGQLRFWWRATRGGQFADLKKMKKAEDLLWGSTSQPSLVEVEVKIQERGLLIERVANARDQLVRVGAPGSPISYGAFPLRDGGGLRFGVVFTLTLRLPDDELHRDDVMASLWAWETFGGIGARTRRGFGAIVCRSIIALGERKPPLLPSSSDTLKVEAWFEKHLTYYVLPSDKQTDVPHLMHTTRPTVSRSGQGFSVRVGRENRKFADVVRDMLKLGGMQEPIPDKVVDALVAWYYPLDRLQRFRQWRRRSEANGSPFGRSHWSEPDEIRDRTTGFRGRHHMRLTTTPKFPRAAFGLPIVFQFKDTIDPSITTLEGVNHKRLSSRLILRPLACGDGRFVSVATILTGPSLPPGGLKLEGDTSGRAIDSSALTSTEAIFAPLNGRTDVLQAFLSFL